MAMVLVVFQWFTSVYRKVIWGINKDVQIILPQVYMYMYVMNCEGLFRYEWQTTSKKALKASKLNKKLSTAHNQEVLCVFTESEPYDTEI